MTTSEAYVWDTVLWRLCVDIDWVVKTANVHSEGLNHEFVTAALGSVASVCPPDPRGNRHTWGARMNSTQKKALPHSGYFPSNFDMTSGTHVALLKSRKNAKLVVAVVGGERLVIFWRK